jgi:uncharacterized membrane protein YgcG
MKFTQPLLLLILCLLTFTSCRKYELHVPQFSEKVDEKRISEKAANLGLNDPYVNIRSWLHGDKLNIRIQSRSKWLARSIRSGDLTMWIDPGAGKKKQFGLQFRGPLLQDFTKNRNDASKTSRRRELPSMDRISHVEEVFLLTSRKDKGMPLTKKSPLNGCQSFFWDTEVWSLDVSLPLNISLDYAEEIVLLSGNTIAIGFDETRETPAMNAMQAKIGKRGGSGSGGGRGGGGGRGSGGGGRGGPENQGGEQTLRLPAELDLWIDMHLAAQ